MKDKEELPKDLKVVITGDQSKLTKTSFNELGQYDRHWVYSCIDYPDVFYGCYQCIFCGIECAAECICCIFVFTDRGWYHWNNVTLNFIVLFALLFGLELLWMMRSW